MTKRFDKTSLFYIAWGIMVIHLCVANSSLNECSISLVSYLAMFIFVIKIFISEYSPRNVMWIGVLILLGLISTFITKDMRTLWYAIVISASLDIDFDKAVKLTLTIMISFVLFAVIVYYVRSLLDGTHSFDFRERMSLGLGHPNLASAYYMQIILLIFYCRYEKISVVYLIMVTIGAVIVYVLTKSNTGFLVTLILLFFMYILKLFRHKKKVSRFIINMVLLGAVVFTVLPIVYNSHFSFLDNLLTGRLHQANYYYLKYGIKIFGSNCLYDLTKWNTDNLLDIGYTRMLLNNGILYYLLIVGGYIIGLKKALKEENFKLITLLCTFMVYMYTENVSTYVFMNVSMLYTGRCLIQDTTKNKKEDTVQVKRQ